MFTNKIDSRKPHLLNLQSKRKTQLARVHLRQIFVTYLQITVEMSYPYIFCSHVLHHVWLRGPSNDGHAFYDRNITLERSSKDALNKT